MCMCALPLWASRAGKVPENLYYSLRWYQNGNGTTEWQLHRQCCHRSFHARIATSSPSAAPPGNSSLSTGGVAVIVVKSQSISGEGGCGEQCCQRGRYCRVPGGWGWFGREDVSIPGATIRAAAAASQVQIVPKNGWGQGQCCQQWRGKSCVVKRWQLRRKRQFSGRRSNTGKEKQKKWPLLGRQCCWQNERPAGRGAVPVGRILHPKWLRWYRAVPEEQWVDSWFLFLFLRRTLNESSSVEPLMAGYMSYIIFWSWRSLEYFMTSLTFKSKSSNKEKVFTIHERSMKYLKGFCSSLSI